MLTSGDSFSPYERLLEVLYLHNSPRICKRAEKAQGSKGQKDKDRERKNLLNPSAYRA